MNGTELKKYVLPVYSGGTMVAQGFIADGHFITAAHVVLDYPMCYIVINGKKRELSKENAVNIGEGDVWYDENVMDVIMYSFDDAVSPLHLSDYQPRKGDILESWCFHEIPNFNSLNPTFELRIVSATARGEEDGYYFYCDCKQTAGSSGSPLLMVNDVVGIMHGGDEKGLCAFLKAKVVKKVMA